MKNKYVYDFQRFVESQEYQNIEDDLSEESYDLPSDHYQDLFIAKLKELFPNGLKLYHTTDKDNLPSIMKHGLDPSYDTRERGIIHTVLGDANINRVGYDDNNVTLEISIPVEEYDMLVPEEATYYDSDVIESEVFEFDPDARDDQYYKLYMDAHPNLIGGDITVYNVIPPSQITVLE